MHKRNLLALAKFLRELVPAPQFNMNFWVNDGLDRGYDPVDAPTQLHECGTSACALGWATRLFPANPDEGWFGYGERVFGLEAGTDDWKTCFSAEHAHLPETATREAAAARIEALVQST